MRDFIIGGLWLHVPAFRVFCFRLCEVAPDAVRLWLVRETPLGYALREELIRQGNLPLAAGITRILNDAGR